jgi:hypothetical protein
MTLAQDTDTAVLSGKVIDLRGHFEQLRQKAKARPDQLAEELLKIDADLKQLAAQLREAHASGSIALPVLLPLSQEAQLLAEAVDRFCAAVLEEIRTK